MKISSTNQQSRAQKLKSGKKRTNQWLFDPAICDALGNPVELGITPGQDADITQTEQNIGPDAFFADKAYDADRLIDRLIQRGITPVIPAKRNRTTREKTDFSLYRERNLV